LTGISDLPKRPRSSWARGLFRGALILGIFLILHAALLGRNDLETSWAPVHLAFASWLATCLYPVAGTPGSWALAVASGAPSLLFHGRDFPWPLAAACWAPLIAGGMWLALRGGTR
jgi:hypothetical protein